MGVAAGQHSALSRIDLCVTTFKRPQAIERLIRSIGDRFPGASVHVGDQNSTVDHRFYEQLALRAGLAEPIRVHDLDFDCGLSAARNELVARTEGEYKLIIDDDFVFTERTRIELLALLLDGRPEAGLVGCRMVARSGRERQVKAHLEKDGGTLWNRHDRSVFRHEAGVRFVVVDFVANFILARRELLAGVQWDPSLKVFEHLDFFLRVKESPFEVLFTPDVVVDHHDVDGEPDYHRFRQRVIYKDRMMRKHGLTEVRSC